jgi:branched-chain amino acid transport system substrate-binding protein
VGHQLETHARPDIRVVIGRRHLKPAGLDKSVGIVSVGILKDPNDPQWDNDPGMKEWRAWMDKYYPDGDRSDGANIYGYLIAQTLMQVLRQCGNNLSRENVMHEAANLHDLELPLLLPGIRITGVRGH